MRLPELRIRPGLDPAASKHVPKDGAGTPRVDRDHRAVFEHLMRWESASLLTGVEADAIRSYEVAEAKPGAGTPVFAEVLGYLGAAFALAAGAALVGPRWADISHVARLAGAGSVAIALFAAGWVIHDSDAASVKRLSGVLWMLSVGAEAAFVGILLFDRTGETAAWSSFALGVAIALYSGALLRIRAAAPLQVALFAGVLTAVGGAGVWAIRLGFDRLDHHPEWFGVAMLVVSVVWIWLGRREVIRPGGVAIGLGAAAAVYAPTLMMPLPGFALVTGVIVALALLGTSVAWRETPMLALGAIGLFGYLVGAIVHFLSGTVGVPVALLLSGVAMLVVALVVARLRRFTETDE